MGAVKKVVNIFDEIVYKEIKMFLEEKHELSKSENTIKEYERDIRHFFEYLRNKDIQYLTKEDIQIPKDDLRYYKKYLAEELGNSTNTIFRKFSTIKGLYKHFYKYDLVGEDSLKTLDKVKVHNKKNEVKHHGHLTVNEVLQMAELVKNQYGAKKRDIKYFLILFALDTCVRLNALLNIKWTDFDVRKDENCVIVKAVDKGNKEFRPKISLDFYNQLLAIKEDDGFVFKISKNSIQDMMNYLNKEMGFSKDRNVKFHSIRKAGISFQYRISGDIMQAKKAANHSSIATTQIYLSDQDYGVIGAVSSKGSIDNSLFEKVTHEELIEGIKSLSKDQILLLNLKLNEIVTKN